MISGLADRGSFLGLVSIQKHVQFQNPIILSNIWIQGITSDWNPVFAEKTVGIVCG